MRTYRFSQLKGKSEKRLRSLMRKEVYRFDKLWAIKLNAREFNIPLNSITVNDINDKLNHCRREKAKINDFWNFKFNDNYRGSLSYTYYWNDSESKKIIQELNEKRK